jgi:hypothetical protein
MNPLPPSAVIQWKNFSGYSVPASIGVNCPHCHGRVIFTTGQEFFDEHRKTVASSAICAACKEKVYVWSIGPSQFSIAVIREPQCILLFPPAHESRQPIEGVNALAGPLRQAYLEAIQVYNAHVWSATATLCRRTLEGIVLHLIGETNETNLAKMLRELPDHHDFAKPITSIANSVRLGGNIGSHFSMDIVPDEELATTMLNLLEYLLEYFFTIPEMVEKATKIRLFGEMRV